MNFLIVVVLIGISINISIEYKTDCEFILPLSCTVYLTPDEDAYQNTLLKSLNLTHKNSHDLGLNPNESDEEKIEEVNKKLQTAFDDDTINRFLKDLFGSSTRGYGVRIKLVPKSIYNHLDSAYTTSKPKTSLPLKDLSGKHKSHNNIFKKMEKALKHKKY